MHNPDGTNPAQVRGQLGKVLNATGNDVILKYSLAPIDPVNTPINDVIPGLLSADEPGVFYELPPVNPNNPGLYALMHWQAAVDNATADHTINLMLNIADDWE
jgi:hypothetical protein